MAWETSDRRDRLPADWGPRRLYVLRRDKYQCQWPGCGDHATEVDHIIHGDDHDYDNLQAICSFHHKQKTQAESQARLRELRAMTKQPIEPNPGSIPRHKAKPRPTKGW